MGTNKTVKTFGVVDLFIKNIFRLHGVPKDIVLDLDMRFVNAIWNGIFGRLRITLKFSSSYHPQTDGQDHSDSRDWVAELRKRGSAELGESPRIVGVYV